VQPDPEALAAFVAAADQRSTAPAIVTPTPIAADEPPRIALVPSVVEATPEESAGARRVRRRSCDEAPWEKYERDARPLSGINVRLNDYEHELLKYLAYVDDRSLQQTIKRLLIPAAEAAARKVRRGE